MLYLNASEADANCQMYQFHKKAPGGYRLLSQYSEQLVVCQEICIWTPGCATVGISDPQTCMVLAATFPCEHAEVWVQEPYELDMP